MYECGSESEAAKNLNDPSLARSNFKKCIQAATTRMLLSTEKLLPSIGNCGT